VFHRDLKSPNLLVHDQAISSTNETCSTKR
jgi:hypothetical protein